mgnify:CR=1 FL=1
MLAIDFSQSTSLDMRHVMTSVFHCIVEYCFSRTHIVNSPLKQIDSDTMADVVLKGPLPMVPTYSSTPPGPGYQSALELLLGRRHSRLFVMNDIFEKPVRFIAICLANCTQLNDYAGEFAAILISFAEQCMSNGSKGFAIAELALRSNYINSQSFTEIVSSFEFMPALVTLDLSNNCLNSTDIGTLSKLLNRGPQRLQRLVLAGNKLGFEGVSRLAEGLKRNKYLFFLDIGCNNIGDSGFALLIGAVQSNPLSRLRWLGVDNCGLTNSAVVSFTTSLRECCGSHRPNAVLRLVVSMMGNQLYNKDILREIKIDRQVSIGTANSVNTKSSNSFIRLADQLIF